MLEEFKSQIEKDMIRHAEIKDMSWKPRDWIIACANTGWDKLTHKEQVHLCVYYIDRNTLTNICQYIREFGIDSKLWNDKDTAHKFDCSIWAQCANQIEYQNSSILVKIASKFTSRSSMPWA